jgi:hypothetical protein
MVEKPGRFRDKHEIESFLLLNAPYLNYSMEHNDSSEADGRSAGKETLGLLWNQEVPCHVCKRLATGTYHEPNESTPHHHTVFLYCPFYWVL